jgi:hypothetical protein
MWLEGQRAVDDIVKRALQLQLRQAAAAGSLQPRDLEAAILHRETSRPMRARR